MAIPKIAPYCLSRAAKLPQNKVNWAFEPSKAVLLIHDVQRYFIDFYGDDSVLIQQVLSNIQELKALCALFNIPVVYTAQPAEQSAQARALLNDMWGPGLTGQQALTAIEPSVAPGPDDIVLTKWRYSAFQRSPLEAMMKEQGRDQLLICGVYGHIGVLMSACDAFMRDIKPFVVADAIADFSLEEHQLTLTYVAGRCGVVAANETFKELRLTRGDTTLLTPDALKNHLLSLIDEEEQAFDPDENLLDYGIDSVQIMAIISKWRDSGIESSFTELAEQPTFNAWVALLQRKQEQAA